MPDFCEFKVEDCYLYFTSKCVIEAMHAHADPRRNRRTAAKFWLFADGRVEIADYGALDKAVVNRLRKFIERNHRDFCEKWVEFCNLSGVSEIQFKEKSVRK